MAERLEICVMVDGVWTPVPDTLLKRVMNARKKISRGATKTGATNDGEVRNAELHKLVKGWFDSFKDVRGFTSSEGGGFVTGVFSTLLCKRTAKELWWEMGSYWDWIEDKGVHAGSLENFRKNENHMHDLYIEKHKGEDICERPTKPTIKPPKLSPPVPPATGS